MLFETICVLSFEQWVVVGAMVGTFDCLSFGVSVGTKGFMQYLFSICMIFVLDF